ncbi:hypothetical protein [Aureimonas mangrovi]|uniref:hypothetical protein n=1 Tax=Aureimonas mangrovi TaxID=2758041 RepID=UPI00163DE3C3|nr:hypothetical protein [Aureimonas mangrovi]
MDAYGHLRVLISLIIGLAITRLLSGLSRRLQEPVQTDWMHAQVVWSVVVLLNAVHFWWWEFSLRFITDWNFWLYVFILSYASLFFLMSTLLFPDNVQERAESEAFFIRRRQVFFSIFAASFAFDLVDTLIKGVQHFQSLGVWYVARLAGGATIALIAMRVRSSRKLTWLGVLWLCVNIVWITALYSELL